MSAKEMSNEKFSIKKRLKSFTYAFAGLSYLIKNEHNAWIHCVAAVLVVTIGFLLRISSAEWIAVVVSIGTVFAAEAFNSAIERLSDMVQPERDERVRVIKDLCAGAVLVCAVSAAVVGCIIFLPKLIALF